MQLINTTSVNFDLYEKKVKAAIDKYNRLVQGLGSNIGLWLKVH